MSIKKYIVGASVLLLAVSLGVLGTMHKPSSLPLELTQTSREELKTLNKKYGITVTSLDRSHRKKRPSFYATALLGSEPPLSPKGLIIAQEDDFFVLEPHTELSEETLKEAAEEYRQIPEFTHVEVDQALKLTQEKEEKGATSEGEEGIEKEKRENIRIGIFDSGIDRTHPLFANIHIDKGWDGIENTVYQKGDSIGHGTHIAGIIAQEAPNAELVPYLIASKQGGRLSDLIVALKKAIQEGDLDIMNMSFGFQEPSPILHGLIQKAVEQGVIVVVAAGNTESDEPVYPAYYPEVIAVGSATRGARTLSSSNYGDWVDVAALGHFVRSSIPDGKYSYKSGTSQAAAYVSAYIAQLLTSKEGDMGGEQVSQYLNQLETKVRTGHLQGVSLVRD